MRRFVKKTSGPGKPPLSATVSSKVHDGEMSRKNELSLWRLLWIKLRDAAESRSQDDDNTSRALKPARGATESTPPKSKGFDDGLESGYAEAQFFVANGDVYGYDYLLVICKFDQQGGVTRAPGLSFNPPIPDSIFIIGGVSFRFNFSGNLFRVTDSGWVLEQIYGIFADACQAAAQGLYLWPSDNTIVPGSSSPSYPPSPYRSETPAAPTFPLGARPYLPGSGASEGNGYNPTPRHQRVPPLVSTISGLGDDRVQPAAPSPAPHNPSSRLSQDQLEINRGGYESPSHSSSNSNVLQPEWLLSGRAPSKQEIDDFIEAVKHERKNHETDVNIPGMSNNRAEEH
ncbi:hypothetical protein FRC06_011686 [Ceratobasidium sp. 370]|nr:hypothetical protein FRC06_011686 [Ceratobasidium sp. 370]